MLKQFFLDSNWILFASLAALNIFMITSLFMTFVYGRTLRTMEDGWMLGAKEALGMKVDRHMSG